MFWTYVYNSIPRIGEDLKFRREPINMNWLYTNTRPEHTAAIADLRTDMFVVEVCISLSTSDQPNPNGQGRSEKVT